MITNFLSVARMSDTFEVPLNRLYAVNSGDSGPVGDRTFTVILEQISHAQPEEEAVAA